jgi:hypothetical protein
MQHHNGVMIFIDESVDQAFADIATNLFAVILMIMALTFVVSAYQNTGTDEHKNLVPQSTKPFDNKQRELFPPFSHFFVVFADRIVAWDQQVVVNALLADPTQHQGVTRQGRYEWIPEWIPVRDIDTFQIKFWFDFEQLHQQVEPFPLTQLATWIQSQQQSASTKRSAPVFLVYPDGMELFAMIHPQLLIARIPFRWFAQLPTEPLLLGRTVDQFTDYGIYW